MRYRACGEVLADGDLNAICLHIRQDTGPDNGRSACGRIDAGWRPRDIPSVSDAEVEAGYTEVADGAGGSLRIPVCKHCRTWMRRSQANATRRPRRPNTPVQADTQWLGTWGLDLFDPGWINYQPKVPAT